ncbi:MAG: response regulator [Anaerolineae bacterium]|jgi:two-component system chemotaxis response regulator CheY|nr:response regulator [Anaerolineae bacterium]
MEKTAWIVDDDRDMRDALAMMLTMNGYEVQQFPDVPQAAKVLVAGAAPALFLLDLNMPMVSGLDFLEFIRKRETWAHIPVILVTSESDETMIEKAIKQGADGYVVKPISLEQLKAAIFTAIERRRAVAGE